MRGTIASLLLVLGTVLGALAAANSAKASRWLVLEQDAYPGEFVARDVPAADGVEAAAVAAGGAELTAEVVAALRAAGHAGVEVKDPPLDHEVLPIAEPAALEGRILAKPIRLGAEDREIEAGLKVTAVLLQRCAAAGKETLDVVVDGEPRTLPTAAAKASSRDGDGGVDAEVDAATAARQAELDREFAAAVEQAVEAGARVAQTFTLREDVTVPAGAFLDAELVGRLVAAGVENADVRIVKGFHLRGWEHRYLYLAALVAMLLGVGLKRAAAAGVEADAAEAAGGLSSAEVTRRIHGLAAKVAALAERIEELEPREIHAALDPLLAEDVYAVVENRHAVAAKLGPTGFVAVYGPFAAAERMLNRAWSAAVDGNAEEARDSIRRSAAGMRVAAEALPPA